MKIKILILTDNIPIWKNKIQKNIKIISYMKSKDSNRLIIASDMFIFEIMSMFNEKIRANYYTCAVFDKALDSNTEFNIIRPHVKDQIIYTHNFNRVSF